VGLLTLYLGLLLPWLGGSLWLAFADRRFNSTNPVNRFRQVGYGFFLGYVVLFLAVLVSNSLTSDVSWPGLMMFLLIFTASGGYAVWQVRGLPHATAPAAQAITSTSLKLLVAVVLLLMAVHLLFIGVEIFTRPVYPWDAWLVWVYRAKAWFMAGNMADIVSPTSWATATSVNTYPIHAWQYPLFPSVIPYWSALSLGRWSETLVNLPVLFAGSAIGMALYGQCREHGLSVAVSLIACYLLYSIPLFATHVALAGYADIWMAGYVGLGFIALIRGASLRDEPGRPGFHLVLGFLMVLFGAWVKNEGAVWFLAALAMLVLVMFRPRVPVLMIISAIGFGFLAFAFGITSVDIPIIGQLGMANGQLTIPFIGSFAVEIHDVRQVYWHNFIEMGNWNLVWVMLAASLALGVKSRNVLSGYRARWATMGFVLILMTTQLFIFGFTNQGLWADTYTAINRLPLHFIPAVLFALIVIAHASLAEKNSINTTAGARSGKA